MALTGVVAFVGFFVGVLGGPYYAARFPVVIAFLFAATTPSGPHSLSDQMLGWAVGTVLAAVASVVLWPAHRRFPIRALTGRACTLTAAVVRADWLDDGSAPVGELRGVIDRLRSVSLEAHLRPGAVAHDERLMSEIVHQVERLVAITVTATEVRAGPDDRPLADTTARTLDDLADALLAEPPSTPVAEPLQPAVLGQAMTDHIESARVRLGHAAGTAGAARAVDDVRCSVRLRPISRATYVAAELTDGVGGTHAFWITLGTFSVLRADVSTTRRSASATVVGTALGFVLSGVVVVVVGGDAAWLLGALLPVSMFFASYAGRFRPELTAAFTVFVVVLATLVAPRASGWPRPV